MIELFYWNMVCSLRKRKGDLEGSSEIFGASISIMGPVCKFFSLVSKGGVLVEQQSIGPKKVILKT